MITTAATTELPSQEFIEGTIIEAIRSDPRNFAECRRLHAEHFTIKEYREAYEDIRTALAGIDLTKVNPEELRTTLCLTDELGKKYTIKQVVGLLEISYTSRLAKLAKEVAPTPEREVAPTPEEEATTKIYKETTRLFRGAVEKMASSYLTTDFNKHIPTGFKNIDSLTGGLGNSDLIILGSYTSIGKTALALNMAMNVAETFKKSHRNEQVLFVSLEMSVDQIVERIMCHQVGCAIKKDTASQEVLQETLQALRNEMARMPLLINDHASLSIEELKKQIRTLRLQKRVSCVFVDCLQLLSNSREPGRMAEDIQGITIGLKQIARECGIPIVAVSQLNRTQKRADRRPHPIDLQESGYIGQTADVVMLLHRGVYYAEGEVEKTRLLDENADLIVFKNRNGATGVAKLTFNESNGRFKDVD